MHEAPRIATLVSGIVLAIAARITTAQPASSQSSLSLTLT